MVFCAEKCVSWWSVPQNWIHSDYSHRFGYPTSADCVMWKSVKQFGQTGNVNMPNCVTQTVQQRSLRNRVKVRARYWANLHNKPEYRTEVAAKQRRHCNCIQQLLPPDYERHHYRVVSCEGGGWYSHLRDHFCFYERGSLSSLGRWDCGFESHLRHGWLVCVCVYSVFVLSCV
jgi:hypothetical protein